MISVISISFLALAIVGIIAHWALNKDKEAKGFIVPSSNDEYEVFVNGEYLATYSIEKGWTCD